MGLIYVNPEGPNGNPDPLAAARDIRETFRRMAMDDEETLALIVGGHSFGKCHGAVSPDYVGPEPEACPVEHQLIGWKNSFGSGKGVDTITSGLEGAWTTTPTQWDTAFLDILFKYDWELTTSPAGAKQWTPTDPSAQGTVPDAHDPSRRHAPMMLTTDLALKLDPIYGPIAQRFHENPDQLADAFAKAWYKLLHRDMGPVTRYLGPWVPAPQLWQDPVPAVDHELIGEADSAALKATLLASGLSVSQLASTAWASAATFRSPTCGAGPTGPGFALRPRRTGRSTSRPNWPRCCRPSGRSSRTSTAQSGGTTVSLADLIVLGGCAAVEQAAKNAGHDVTVPFTPGARTPPRSRPTWRRSPCSSRRRTGSATTSGPERSCRRRRCCWTGPTC